MLKRQALGQKKGVNHGNIASSLACLYSQRSQRLRLGKFGEVLHGPNGYYAQIIRWGSELIALSSDGIGTKIEIAERVGRYDSLGFDLVAMVADDLVAVGATPVTLMNVWDADQMDIEIWEQLLSGLGAACQLTDMSISGGEIALLGARVGGYGTQMHGNWSATGLGAFTSAADIIDGTKIKSGHRVVALKETGMRSNGFTLARKILEQKFGETWHTQIFAGEMTWAEALLTPSCIYSPLLVAAKKMEIEFSGVAHITGGGIIENLARMLRVLGYGVHLTALHEVPSVMQKMMFFADLSYANAFFEWNMGNGMFVTLEERHLGAFFNLGKELGYELLDAGCVTEASNIVIDTANCQWASDLQTIRGKGTPYETL